MARIAPLIFVSSTSADLLDHRAAILKSFPALDVLYRGMEFFGARPERPIRTMLAELAECDLYLGILAHRYGSIDEKGVSYTELEYRFAKQHGMPRLIFLMDPTCKVPPDSVEKDAGRVQKLEALKLDAQTDGVVEFFLSADDLVAKIAHALRRWLSDNESRWKNLKQLPLSNRESTYIDDLYSADEGKIVDAIHQLSRPDCRPALEHFYSLLCYQGTTLTVAKAVFQQIIFCSDEQRVAQVLLQIIVKRPKHRARAIRSIGERAAIASRHVSDLELDQLLKFANDPDWEVRLEVAHSLSNIGNSRLDRLEDCRKGIESLSNDPNRDVVKRVELSLDRLRGRPAGPE